MLSTQENIADAPCLKIRCEGEEDETKPFQQIPGNTGDTFMVVNDLYLEPGSEFRFILEMQNGETLQSDLFTPGIYTKQAFLLFWIVASLLLFFNPPETNTHAYFKQKSAPLSAGESYNQSHNT